MAAVTHPNGIWKALNDCTYVWGQYKIYRSVHGWTCWQFGSKSRRVGNTELMSEAMEMARKDSQQ